jgi:hypothetical protein
MVDCAHRHTCPDRSGQEIGDKLLTKWHVSLMTVAAVRDGPFGPVRTRVHDALLSAR